VTPLAALANDDIAAADNGAIPSMAGGGSTFVATSVPFVEGGNGSPPAVTGNEAACAPFVVVVDGPSPRSARLSISVDGGTDSDLVISLNMTCRGEDILCFLTRSWSFRTILSSKLGNSLLISFITKTQSGKLTVC
jgi:hypothetical protein